jgi:acetyl esterase
MAKLPTRERAIQIGKLLHKIQIVANRLQLNPAGSKKRALRQEVFLHTDFGTVRTLWYGFEKKEITPVYFDLHGGGFILGTADMDEAMNVEVNRKVGCKIISIEYAKAPEFPYPAAVNQVYAVVKKIFEDAEKYAIDPHRMAIGGHSAGGNLSTVTCMKAIKEGEFQFVCQILDYPPLDLATSALDKPQPEGCIPPKVAAIFDACYVDPLYAKDPYVSPVYATLQELHGLPPVLLILAGRDSLYDEGLKYSHRLAEAGVLTECVDYPHAVHGFTLNPSSDTTDAHDKMAAFLQKYLCQ